jgi:hypothetical protein
MLFPRDGNLTYKSYLHETGDLKYQESQFSYWFEPKMYQIRF